MFLPATDRAAHEDHVGDFITSDASCTRSHLAPHLVEGPGALAGTTPRALAHADLDNDGFADLLVTNQFGNEVSVLRGLGTGAFAARVGYAVPQPVWIEAADLDGDHDVDVVASNNTAIYALMGNGDGSLQPPQPIVTLSGGTARMRVVDFDRNGTPDVLFATPGAVVIAQRLPDGTFTSGPTVIGVAPIDFVTGDLDGDQKLDIVTINSDNTLSVVRGKGNGTFFTPAHSVIGEQPTALAIGDLDLDGNPDLAITVAGAVAIRIGNGDGTFQPALVKTAGANPGAVAIADVSNDGAPDVVVANFNSRFVSVLSGYGTGELDDARHYKSPSEPRDIEIADFDTDGKPDLALAIYFGNFVQMRLSSRVGYDLTIELVGAGSGGIFGGPALGQLCPGFFCTTTFPVGQVVGLSAFPDAGSTFVEWGGACTGSSTICFVTMDAAKYVTARFEPVVITTTLLMSMSGASGSINAGPAYGELCSTAVFQCTKSVPLGTTLTLTAVPAPGSVFTGWGGGWCTGTGPCVITMDAFKQVMASFSSAGTMYPLTTAIDGAGSIGGSLGELCPGACSTSVLAGTTVTLVATPAPGYVFYTWGSPGGGGGGTCSGSGTCTFTMSNAASIVAVFKPAAATVTLTTSVSGHGGLFGGPAIGQLCPGDCTRTMATGSSIGITAFPDPGSVLVSWGGACSGVPASQSFCSVTLDADTFVSATFSP